MLAVQRLVAVLEAFTSTSLFLAEPAELY